MADPKAQAAKASASASATEADKQASAADAHAEAVSSPQKRLIVVGKLRRDTMILDSGTDQDQLFALASSAVREGRASEVFIIEALGYFSEAEIDFIPRPQATEGRYADQSPDRVPLLNPSTGEQSLDAAKADPGNAPTAETPTHGAQASGDDNKGAGTGTGKAPETK